MSIVGTSKKCAFPHEGIAYFGGSKSSFVSPVAWGVVFGNLCHLGSCFQGIPWGLSILTVGVQAAPSWSALNGTEVGPWSQRHSEGSNKQAGCSLSQHAYNWWCSASFNLGLKMMLWLKPAATARGCYPAPMILLPYMDPHQWWCPLLGCCITGCDNDTPPPSPKCGNPNLQNLWM